MPSSIDPQMLAGLPLFADLTPEQLAELHTQLRRVRFAPAAPIMTAEQPGEAAYIIVDGTVKVHMEQADGAEVILAILGPGEMVGELSLLENQGRSANVTTLEETNALWLDRVAFQRALAEMPQLSLNLARLLGRRLRLANSHIQSLANKDVFGRLACLVLAFDEAYGRPAGDGDRLIPVRLTQSDLASLVGASRVRVNQVLVFYKERRYLSVDGRFHITVHNAAALAQRCL